MCTLTWWAGGGDYEVFFNRDEMKSRPVATAPEFSEMNGVRFLAPRDPAAGGTWVLVNELGVTITLLNWYSRETVPKPGEATRSRGRLVLQLGDVTNSVMLEDRLASFDPNLFQPFRLLAFFPKRPELKIDFWQWSGVGEFERLPCPPLPICSSSFDRDSVIAQRQSELTEVLAGGADPDHLWAYHRNSGSSECSAYTVRMNRPDAQTWSISRVSVHPEAVRFRYEAELLDLIGKPEVFESSLERSGNCDVDNTP